MSELMSGFDTCSTTGCGRPVDVAIASRAPRSKQGLVSTIYQFPEDAPKRASRLCVQHGMELASELARLSNPEGSR